MALVRLSLANLLWLSFGDSEWKDALNLSFHIKKIQVALYAIVKVMFPISEVKFLELVYDADVWKDK